MERHVALPPPLPKRNQTSLSNSQEIITQQSDAPRATDARQDISYHNINQSFFKRLYSVWPNIVTHILFNCSLKTILKFRLVSKKSLLDSIKPIKNEPSLLANKAFISFRRSHIYPSVQPKVREKFDFAQESNMPICLTIPLKERSHFSEIFNSIFKNQVSLILTIENLNEINLLQRSLANYSNKEFFNMIKELDFEQITIGNETNGPISTLLTSISQNLHLFTNLTKLKLGTIAANYAFEIPDLHDQLPTLIIGHHDILLSSSSMSLSIKNIEIGAYLKLNSVQNQFHECKENFTLPNALKNLRKLSIEACLENNTDFNLLSSLSNLRKLSIRELGNNTNFSLPDTLNKLTTLIIKKIGNNVIIALPDAFKDLKNLTIGQMRHHLEKDCYVTFKLPKVLDSLEQLTIQYIDSSRITLPQTLNGLKSLTLGSISEDNILILPGLLDNLASLNITHTWDSSKLKLPNSLPNLTLLTIDRVNFQEPDEFMPKVIHKVGVTSIQKKPNLNFIDSFHALTSLSLDGICDYTILEFSDSLNTLETLFIKAIGLDVTFAVFNSFNKITTLSIEKFCGLDTLKWSNSFNQLETLILKQGFNASEWSNSLNNLKTLSIETIPHTADWSNSLNNLKALFIQLVRANGFSAALKWSNLLNNLETFSIEDIELNSTFELSDSLNSLKTLALNDIKNLSLILSNSLNNLENLSIKVTGYSFTEIKNVGMTEGMQSTETRVVSHSPSFKLFNSLQRLVTLSIGSIYENTTFELPNSLPNLRTFSIDSIEANGTLKIPSSFSMQINLTIKTVHKYAKLDLPWFLDNQTKNALRSIWAKATHS